MVIIDQQAHLQRYIRVEYALKMINVDKVQKKTFVETKIIIEE
jgi:hypothetical protein